MRRFPALAFAVLVLTAAGPVIAQVNPLGGGGGGATADRWAGRYAGDGMVLELAGAAGQYTGKILFGGQTFPVVGKVGMGGMSGFF